MGSTETTNRAWSGTRMGPRPIKALVLRGIDGAQEGGTASVVGSTPMVFQAEMYAIKVHIMENTE